MKAITDTGHKFDHCVTPVVHSIKTRNGTRNVNRGSSIGKMVMKPINTIKRQTKISKLTKMQRVIESLKNIRL
jgi:hypothetical protein